MIVYAFSTENWSRESQEVNALMNLINFGVDVKLPDIVKNEMKLEFIGDLSKLPTSAQKGIEKCVESTKQFSNFTLVIALNYGAIWDIVETFKKMVKNNIEMTESNFLSNTQISNTNVDIFIRTGGDRRLSNFLLHNLSYSELFFSDKLWPDFNERDLKEIIDSFESRQRRFWKMNKLSIFGFTGSIGSQALDLLERKDEYDYHIFICNKNIEKAEYVLEKFKPKYLFFSDQSASQKFNSKKFPSTNLILSKEELLKVIHDEPSDVYLSAISSFEMIDVTYLLAKSGKKILLANKESLVIFGSVIMDEAQINNTKIIPIDSEHYSIYHSLKNAKIHNIKKIFLMASGGPFHGVALEDAIQKSPEEALNHPNWDMGKK